MTQPKLFFSRHLPATFSLSMAFSMASSMASSMVLTVLVAALLVGCASPGSTSRPVGDMDGDTDGSTDVVVAKSPNDPREYRYLVLENELRVLLVSDPATDKAAASLSVLRGYYQEPAEYPGLAHFLEHMLFIGTEKYPEVDGYQQFIATHGGSSNAYTSSDHTNYFFDVAPEQFESAMDRFSQFFISPLLDSAYVEREKNAVHSEYQMQIKDDGWRSAAVVKTAMEPDYVGSQFYIGSLETLGEGVDEALVRFFEDEYSSDQMVLVALSNQPLDGMESWIRPMFSAIENKRIGPAPAPGRALDSDRLPSRLTYQSLSNRYQLSFNFPVPPIDPYYRTKPAQYLTNLLGHEGDGSLHQLLKSKGWIESLGAGVHRLDESNALLFVNIDLTPSGREATDEISALLFGYIELLNSQAPETWRYDEQARAADLSFTHQEQSSPTGFVYRVSPNLARYPAEEVLVADYLMEGFDADLIREYLSYLRPDNVLIELAGPNLETDQVEAWFEVPYRLETMIAPMERVEVATLELPEPNPFLPDALALTVETTTTPSLAVDEPGARLWLAPDVEFRVPRANQTFFLGIEGGLISARDLALAQIYTRLVNDALNPYAYPAMLAGLSYRIGTSPAGFRITVAGYSEKQPVLLERIVDEFTGLDVDAERFARYQSELIRDWRNFSHERPYTQSYAALSQLLLSTSFAPENLADAAQALTPEDLFSWRTEHLNEISVVGLSHGNLDERALDEINTLLSNRLNLTEFPLTRPELTLVEEPLVLELPVDHDDAAMVLYVQDPEATFESRAKSALIAQILGQPFFSSLRTEQQLGYVVSMSNRTLLNRGSLVFIIQSPVASVAALEAATIEFMQAQLPLVANMDEETFAQFKTGLVGRLTERAKNLRERTARYLSDLEADVITFDSQMQIAGIVSALTLEEVTEYLTESIDRLKNARLLIFSRGQFEEIPTHSRRLPGSNAFKADEGALPSAAD